MDQLSTEQSRMLAMAMQVGLQRIELSPRSNSVYGWQGATRYKVSDHFAGYKQHGYYKPPRPQCIRDIHNHFPASSAAITGCVDELISRQPKPKSNGRKRNGH